MKAHHISLSNALILIFFSLWGYLASDNPSPTALIPTFAGVALVFLYAGLKNENKVQAHIAVIITLVILIGLIKPLISTIEKDELLLIIRVLTMIFSTFLSLIFFVKSFINARKNKKN
mgnify:CR=1 FL=1